MTQPAVTPWDARFSTPEYVFGTEPNHWLVANAGHWRAGDHVLCVADGEGRNSVWLAQHGLRVDAFDVSPVGLEKARKLATQAGVQVNYVQASSDSYDWPLEQLDGIAAIFVQFADPDMRERMVAHMKRALKPGGVLVLQGYTPAQLALGTGGPRELSHLYTEPMLESLFNDVDILALETYERLLDEGAGHCGPSALIGLTARRR